MKDTSKKVDECSIRFVLEKIKDKKIRQITLHLPEILANRPKITATFGRIIYELLDGKKFKKILPFLASIELAHTSTYILDDIIDNQTMRQGKKSTWNKFGLNYGIVAGSLQTFLSKSMLYNTKLSHKHLLQISRLMDEMWVTLWIGEGKNEEMKEKTTQTKYIQRCYEIAGVMLSCTAKIIAISCKKNDKEVEEIGKIGEYFGIGAMIRNDLMNFLPKKIIRKGKANALLGHEYEDIRKGLWTFPIISAMQKAKGNQSKYIISLLGKKEVTDEEVIKLIKILIELRAIEKTLNLITSYKKKAEKIVNKLFLDSLKRNLLLDFLENLENSRLYFSRFKKQF